MDEQQATEAYLGKHVRIKNFLTLPPEEAESNESFATVYFDPFYLAEMIPTIGRIGKVYEVLEASDEDPLRVSVLFENEEYTLNWVYFPHDIELVEK